MMINKRLLNTVPESKKYIAANVFLQWCGLCANISIIIAIALFLQRSSTLVPSKAFIAHLFSFILLCICFKFICTLTAAKMAHLSSRQIKIHLRQQIYSKMLALGTNYSEKVSTAQTLQFAVEGVEQLETYFGAYLPQFFYSMIAPLTLFFVLCFVRFQSALVLLLCVPLIPITIALIQTFAKKLLSKYWGQYTALGDIFLENLQGLTTLKVYQADEFKNHEMNIQAEKFRKITMKVLTMQLNSVTVMDVIAYGGAALGTILAVTQLNAGLISLAGALCIILLSAEFFIPMRLLGSFFHIAMNGMAASEKIFNLLDLPVPHQPQETRDILHGQLEIRELNFSYTTERTILKNIAMTFPEKTFTAIVGESGSGKSTIAALLTGKYKNFQGNITLGEVHLKNLNDADLSKQITYVGFDSYLFKGTLRENLLMANPNASDETLWQVLKKVNLEEFLKSEKGLDTVLMEKATNFSGGQRQRLALARAILHDTPIYIFDEATSNVDVESENTIMAQIQSLAQSKTVIMITHRLANTQKTDYIYTLKAGQVVEQGDYATLINACGHFKEMWRQQSIFEAYSQE